MTSSDFLLILAGCASGLDGIQRERSSNDDGQVEVATEHPNRHVTIGPTRLRYFEGTNVLSLVVEMASDRRGPLYVVYVPTARSWHRETPEWARERREEIMAEIKRLTSDNRIRWVEED